LAHQTPCASGSSYAEYTRAPVSNVALIEADLPWAELTAIPETFATAWTCLFRSLEISKRQLLVIRDSSALPCRHAYRRPAVSRGCRKGGLTCGLALDRLHA
jgi:NADPH:quinone reductase